MKWGELIEGDIRNESEIRAALEKTRPDAVMHFAANIEVGEGEKAPGAFYENNVAGTLNVVRAMLDLGLQNFIFSSTCKHCQTDVPQLVEFEKTHADAYDIIGITKIKNDRHRKVSTKYFKDQGIEFPILEDAGRVSELLKVTSTPTTLYVAPEGMVVKATYYQHRELEKDYLSYLPQLRGAPAPPPSPRKKGWHFPLKVKDAKGEVVDLARSEGKPTLIHFWATWCGPCVKELPEFMERVPELEKEGDVYLITVEDDPAAVAKYEKKSGLSLGSYLSPHEGLAENLDFSRSVPRTYVLDGNGNVTRLLRGSYDWKDPHRFANILNRMSK
ncbi:MAG: redoxin domain-containing protein [Acidobacteriota bacterium]